MSREKRIYKLGQMALSSSDINITGRGIAEVIKFLMRKIPYEKRPHSIMSLRQKIWNLNEYDMASKKSPNTAAMGQSITFIKTLLNGRAPGFIRNVLSVVVQGL